MEMERESRSSRASDSPGDTMNDVYAAWREYLKLFYRINTCLETRTLEAVVSELISNSNFTVIYSFK